MGSFRSVVHLAVVLAVALVLSGCGDDDAGDGQPTTSAVTGTESLETSSSTAAGPGDAGATTTGVAADPLLVETTLGPVRGGPSAVDGVRNFLAIPFAEPPVGENAFRAPVPREPWTTPLDAVEPGPSCPQTTEGVTTSIVITPDPDPDCLSLSVWTPVDAEGLPVMVWFHGGGLTTGSAHELYYTGDDLAAEGVVVVNVNYRLGPLGFLALEELAAESPEGAVGNYGFLDQQVALEWVRDNIAGFGGDPDAVTIFGESAGGFSVCAHLAAPGSQGLFARAIVQSGGGCKRLAPLPSALADGSALLAEVGCADVACLRATPDEEIIAAAATAEFEAGLVSDGVVLSESAYELAGSGELDDIQVLIGSNADESTLFTLSVEVPDGSALRELASEFTADPDALVALYPADRFESDKARYQAMFTDVVFTCPTLEFASVAPKAFVYHYTWVSESNPLGLGATHGAELATLFGHPEGLRVETERTDASNQVSDMIQGAWVAFAATGDPGQPFEPYRDGRAVTILDTRPQQVAEIRDGRCEAVSELSTIDS